MTAPGEDQRLAAARRLHARGVRENNAGRPARALPLLRRALDQLTDLAPEAGDHALTARIWISVATSESELGGLARGLAAIGNAAPFVSTAGQPGLQVLFDNQLGYMQVRGGQVREGLRNLDAAVAAMQHAEETLRYSILLNRGTTHLFRGDLPRARADLAAAADLAEAGDLRLNEVMARHNLGYLEYLAGNLAVALRTMDDVLSVDVEFSRAVVLLDRSRVLFEAGLHREADESLVEAEKLFRADRLWKDVAEVELARAECALVDGEIAAARRLAGSARDRFRRRVNDRWRRDAELVLLQADAAAGRPGARLAPVALRLAEEFRAEGLATRARTTQLIAADSLLRAGRVGQAREVAVRAGPVRAGDPISARLHTRLVRAKLALATGTPEEVRREIRTGLDELQRHRSRFGSLDLQVAGAVHGVQLAELDLSLALAGGNASTVLAAVEKARSLSSRFQAVQAPQDAEVAELLSDLRRVTEELRTIESDPSSARRVASQRKRAGDIQRQLRSLAWRSEGTGQAARPATLGDTLAAVEAADSVFVSLVESDGALHAVLLGAGRPRVLALGPAARANELGRRVRADLDVLANGYLPEAMQSTVTGSLRRSLTALDTMLLTPLGLGSQRMVISPTGSLSTLPWGLLPSQRGRPIVVAGSATAWLAANAVPASAGGHRIAVFAGPDLEYAHHEAAAVTAFWPGSTVYAGPGAQQAALRSAMTEATVVHIAAHGRHQPENPLFSSLQLADGPVFAYEFDQTAGAAEHVVLSACELGQATIRPGDEALGWTSVMLHLGTRSVVAGVARVSDEISARAMVRYHRLLADGADSAAALATAIDVEGELPLPFVCFGASWRPGGPGPDLDGAHPGP